MSQPERNWLMNWKRLLHLPLASLFNRLLSLLHKGEPFHFSREDIRWMNFSFSQFGEDLALQIYARSLHLQHGFYVDAGAYHPHSFSNTLLLHTQGWSGVNIDISPEKIVLFQEHRPHDLNVQAWLSDKEEEVQYLSRNTPIDRILTPGETVDDADRPYLKPARTATLTQVLELHGVAPRPIDYLNIDCEGHDLAVLQGLDLARYPVRILTIEALDAATESQIIAYAQTHGFEFKQKLFLTLFFVRSV